MKQLKIALICKNENSTKRDDRSMGYFSYAVPEFTWQHFTPGKNFTIKWKDYKEQGFDLVFHEDYPYGNVIGLDVPYVFLSIDSTLSDEHYKARLRQTSLANLVLVDHDRLERFKTNHCNTYQFPYCVNDKIFFRYETEDERTNDIAYHCSSSAHAGINERKRIRQLLHDLSVKHGWSYRSGVHEIHHYAESFRTSKIVVNQSRTPTNRPHRIFDAMSCGAMVLTSPLPKIESDGTTPLIDYLQFTNDKQLENALLAIFKSNVYESISEIGYQNIMQNHTWSIRAKQLREIINKEFGI